MAEKTRYSDAELEEFRAIINEKLELAQRDYEQLKLLWYVSRIRRMASAAKLES